MTACDSLRSIVQAWGPCARCASQAQPQRCVYESCTHAYAATHCVPAQIGYTPYSYMSGDQGCYLAPGITVVTDTTYNHPWRYEHVQPPNRISWVAARTRDGSTRSFMGPVRHQHQVCSECAFQASIFEPRLGFPCNELSFAAPRERTAAQASQLGCGACGIAQPGATWRAIHQQHQAGAELQTTTASRIKQ